MKNPFAEFGCHGDLVSGHNYGGALEIESAEQLEEIARVFHIEIAGGLIGEKQQRFLRPRDSGAEPRRKS